MIYLRLFWEFFKVGLFSVGGGLATLPFLYSLGAKTGWFSTADVANMLAVSESTPGPIGVNMATYAGFDCGGVLGGVGRQRVALRPDIRLHAGNDLVQSVHSGTRLTSGCSGRS